MWRRQFRTAYNTGNTEVAFSLDGKSRKNVTVLFLHGATSSENIIIISISVYFHLAGEYERVIPMYIVVWQTTQNEFVFRYIMS